MPLDGLVYDKETNLPLANAKVVINEGGNNFAEVQTDDKGKFKSCLSIGQNYDFIASKNEYKENKVSINGVNDEPQTIKIPLSKIPAFTLEGHVYLKKTNHH